MGIARRVFDRSLAAASFAKRNIVRAPEWIARLGELMIVAAAFRLAAEQANSALVAVMANLVLIAAAFHLNQPVAHMTQLALKSADHLRGRISWAALLTTFVVSVAITWLMNHELVLALNSMIEPSLKH